MSEAVSPPDYTRDARRLEAVEDYRILDTPAEPGFDDIVQITSVVCNTPVALVSIVAGDRQWFKAKKGLEACETDIGSSVCAFALAEPDLLVISDLTSDDRTRANPLVTGPPNIRFYAGAPLRRDDGQTIGSLCAIDIVPRPGGLTASQATTLRSLARQVMTQLELRRALAERDVLLGERLEAETRRNALLQLGDRLRDLTTVGEMTRAASEIVGRTLGATRAGFGRLVDEGEHLVVEPDWTAPGVASVAGRHRFADYGDILDELRHGRPLVVEDVTTDPRTRESPRPLLDLGIRALVNMPVLDRGRPVALFLVHDDVPRVWTPEVLTFLRNVADRVEVGVARVKAEADQQVLNRELSHRMKNSFAMVQAIAKQTLRQAAHQEALDAFEQRLQALASAHDVLLRESWVAAPLKQVVRKVLAVTQSIDRYDIAGPAIRLGARATLSVSLLLHELATNAVKHGALSTAEGRVEVAWRLERGETDGEFTMTWREHGGPTAVEPSGRGFGSRLIRMGLLGTGGADIRYMPTGLLAEFSAPLAEIRQTEGRDGRGPVRK